LRFCLSRLFPGFERSLALSSPDGLSFSLLSYSTSPGFPVRLCRILLSCAADQSSFRGVFLVVGVGSNFFDDPQTCAAVGRFPDPGDGEKGKCCLSLLTLHP